MLVLRHDLPASFATKPDVKRMLFSPNDTLEALKENIFATVGLHPALKPAVRITSEKPLVPLGPDLTDTDSVLKSLDIPLSEVGENKWHNHNLASNVIVDCSRPDGMVELLRSLHGTHELKQAHRLVADQTELRSASSS